MADQYSDPTRIFWRRFFALVLDVSLGWIAVVAAQSYAANVGVAVSQDDPRCVTGDVLCAGYTEGDRYILDSGQALPYWILLGAAFVVPLLNFIVLQGLTGATVGKFALGIRTVSGESDGKPGILRALLRTLVGFIDFICYGLVGIITYHRSQNHRRVADMIAGTIVVRKDAMRRKGEPPRSAASRGPAPLAGIATPMGLPVAGPPGQPGFPQPGYQPPAYPPPAYPSPGGPGAVPPPGLAGSPAPGAPEAPRWPPAPKPATPPDASDA